MSRLSASVLLLVVTLFGFSNCGDDEEPGSNTTGITFDDLEGVWEATQAEYYSLADGPVLAIDIVEEGGNVFMEIEGNGDFVLELTEAGLATEYITGNMEFDEELVRLYFDTSPDDWAYFTIDLTEPALTLSSNFVEEAYDFDNDGTGEDASVYFMFVRD